MRYRFAFVSLMLLTLAAMGGCAHTVAPLSEQPTDTQRGSRTFGAFIEDASIEHKVRVNLLRELPEDSHPHISVVSFNGNVLMVGQVESSSIRQQAEKIASSVRHVRKVYNELEVQGNASALARTNDSWLTLKTKNRLLFNPQTPYKRTKVVTENGVVYLMGLLTHQEAEAVAAEAQKVYGSQKIVKVFEYID